MSLQPGEEVIMRAQRSRLMLLPHLLAMTLLLAGGAFMTKTRDEPMWVMGAGIAAAIVAVIAIALIVKLRSEVYILTNRRVSKQTGLISKQSFDTYLDKINNVEVGQSMWGRLLRFGQVEIDTASESGKTIFPSIVDPLRFRGAILAAAHDARTGARHLVSAPSGAERMREIKKLLDEGLITAEEYEAKRKELVEKL